MTKTDTRDIKATVSQIKGLEEAGCEIVRCAVPDLDAAKALKSIKQKVNIPVVADIHFHYQLALESLKSGVDFLRLNPGNIRDRSKVELIVKEAKQREVPIRIGVNFGSLPPVGKIGLTKGGSRHKDGVNKLPKEEETGEAYTIVDHMVQTGLWEISILEDLDFDLIKLSLKAFDVDTTVKAYTRMANLVPYPLHLGITESGKLLSGSVRSSIGIGLLLSQGIGDTLRVSLADDPIREVDVGWDILNSLDIRQNKPTLVACPSCGRADVDVIRLSNQVEDMLASLNSTIKVAVMGCEVNGPGEAKDADIGIAAGVGRAIIFRKGEMVKVVEENKMLLALKEEIGKFEND